MSLGVAGSPRSRLQRLLMRSIFHLDKKIPALLPPTAEDCAGVTKEMQQTDSSYLPSFRCVRCGED
jgi:hypothetical protein